MTNTIRASQAARGWRTARTLRFDDAEWTAAGQASSAIGVSTSQAARALFEIALGDPQLRDRVKQHIANPTDE